MINRPGDLRALSLLPWAYFFQKRFDKAIIAFKHTHTFNRKDPVALIGMGWCYFSLKYYEKALDDIDNLTPRLSIDDRSFVRIVENKI